MPAVTDWRDAQSYGYTGCLDGSGWAWEFLRRNPDYQADFERCRQAEVAGSKEAAHRMEAASQRWGLRFPGRSRSHRYRSDDRLAA